MRVLKDPLVLFVAIGAAIFAAYSFSPSAAKFEAERRIAIDAPTQEWLYDNFTKQFRREPTRAEMAALVRAHIGQEIKYREALAMGLDEEDSIVRRRMMQKFDFLFGDAAAETVPEDDALKDWYEANPDEFRVPATLSFRHIWFSPDSRGNAVEADAAAALAALRVDEPAHGDPFPFETAFARATRAEVRNVLGAEFTRSVFDAPMNVWSGPIESGLGHHLVLVTEKTEAEMLPFNEVRDAVLENWRESESDRILAEMLATLEVDYEVEIDEDALGGFDYAPEGMGHAP